MSKQRKVFTKKEFDESFEQIFSYISKDSEQNSRKFAQEVEKTMKWIINNPTAGTPEIKIYSKKKWYRFKIVMKRWKIVYKVTNSLLIFLKILHMKQDPNDVGKLRTKNYR